MYQWILTNNFWVKLNPYYSSKYFNGKNVGCRGNATIESCVIFRLTHWNYVYVILFSSHFKFKFWSPNVGRKCWRPLIKSLLTVINLFVSGILLSFCFLYSYKKMQANSKFKKQFQFCFLHGRRAYLTLW